MIRDSQSTDRSDNILPGDLPKAILNIYPSFPAFGEKEDYCMEVLMYRIAGVAYHWATCQSSLSFFMIVLKLMNLLVEVVVATPTDLGMGRGEGGRLGYMVEECS